MDTIELLRDVIELQDRVSGVRDDIQAVLGRLIAGVDEALRAIDGE